MSAAGNIVWFVLLGWVPGVISYLFGAILYVTWIFIPTAQQYFQSGKLCLAPFGKDIVTTKQLNAARASVQSDPELAVGEWGEAKGLLGLRKIRYSINLTLFFIFLPINIIQVFVLVPKALILFITIVGIPLALQDLKIMSYLAWPQGRRVVSIELAKRVRNELAEIDLKQ